MVQLASLLNCKSLSLSLSICVCVYHIAFKLLEHLEFVTRVIWRKQIKDIWKNEKKKEGKQNGTHARKLEKMTVQSMVSFSTFSLTNLKLAIFISFIVLT